MVNGMYHEIHGEGEPLVLLDGAYMTVDGMAPLLGPLASYRTKSGRKRRRS
jgi:hypothetical protein